MSRRPRLIAVIVVGFVAAAILVAYVPLPAPVIRTLAVASAPWIVAPGPSDGRVVAAAKRLWRGYLQTSIAAFVSGDIGRTDGNDVAVLAALLDRSRGLIITTPEDVHRYDPAQMPAIVSGVGYCDQINGFIAAAAARRFPKAELYALYDAANHVTPHTVGRVWSPQRNEWLYFDAFFDQPLVFRKDDRGNVEVLWTRNAYWKIRMAAPEGIYRLPGWTLSDFPSNFPEYLIGRAIHRHPSGEKDVPAVNGAARPDPLEGRAITAREPPLAREVPASAEGGDPSELHERPQLALESTIQSPRRFVATRDDNAYSAVAESFVAARVAHLLGHPDPDAYQAVATDRRATRDDRAAELAVIAARFATLLRDPRR